MVIVLFLFLWQGGVFLFGLILSAAFKAWEYILMVVMSSVIYNRSTSMFDSYTVLGTVIIK
jgi:hypothetical protein